jgi:tripartite-type tricarboxylate transporter receptor subunit TctC
MRLGVSLQQSGPPRAASPADNCLQSAAEIAVIQKDPAAEKRIRDLGAEPIIAGAEQFTRFYRDEIEKWAAVIKHAGLRID